MSLASHRLQISKLFSLAWLFSNSKCSSLSITRAWIRMMAEVSAENSQAFQFKKVSNHSWMLKQSSVWKLNKNQARFWKYLGSGRRSVQTHFLHFILLVDSSAEVRVWRKLQNLVPKIQNSPPSRIATKFPKPKIHCQILKKITSRPVGGRFPGTKRAKLVWNKLWTWLFGGAWKRCKCRVFWWCF